MIPHLHSPAMNAFRWITFCAAGIATAAMAQNSSAGRFALTGAVQPNGGGIAAGGRYRLVGTVDQPTVADTTAGRYQLASGFWTRFTVVQTPDAPILHIELLPEGQVRLHWAMTKAAFSLEGTSDLADAGWQSISSRPVSDGVEYSVTFNLTDPVRCFRLQPVTAVIGVNAATDRSGP